jgi:multicomponent Na+:H+ antiporter subunit B
MMKNILRHIIALLLALSLVLVLVISLTKGGGWPDLLQSRIIANGVADTGAGNLVASVYLGYRALDTLGETIVLLLAVSGLLYIIKEKKK